MEKTVPKDCLRIYGVLTLKSAGDAIKIRKEMLEIQEETRKEDGCLQSDAYIMEGDDPKEATKLYVMALWRDSSSFDAHMRTKHVEEFMKRNESLIVSREVGRYRVFQ